MDSISPGAAWVILGLVLVGAEMASGTFVMLLFGVACFVTAVVTSLGITTSIQSQLLVLGITSVSTLGFFRGRLHEVWKKFGVGKYQNDLGESLILTASIAKGGSAEVSYQGTKWTAVNDADRDLAAGDSVRIVRSEGVKLIVR